MLASLRRLLKATQVRVGRHCHVHRKSNGHAGRRVSIIQEANFTRILIRIDSGIDIVFMNNCEQSGLPWQNLKNMEEIRSLLRHFYKTPRGWTPFSTHLKSRVIDPLLFGKLAQKGDGIGGTALAKGLNCIALTDGLASNEDPIPRTRIPENPLHVIGNTRARLIEEQQRLGLPAGLEDKALRLEVAQSKRTFSLSVLFKTEIDVCCVPSRSRSPGPGLLALARLPRKGRTLG